MFFKCMRKHAGNHVDSENSGSQIESSLIDISSQLEGSFKDIRSIGEIVRIVMAEKDPYLAHYLKSNNFEFVYLMIGSNINLEPFGFNSFHGLSRVDLFDIFEKAINDWKALIADQGIILNKH